MKSDTWERFEEEAQGLGDVLDAETERLNVAFAEAEQLINGALPGVSAYVLLENDPDGPELGYERLGKHWKITITVDPDDEPMPVRNAPRDLRILAASKLDDLIEAVRVKIVEETKRVREATEQLNTFLAAIEPEPRGPSLPAAPKRKKSKPPAAPELVVVHRRTKKP